MARAAAARYALHVDVGPGVTVPLTRWEPVHPAAQDTFSVAGSAPNDAAPPRDPALAAALVSSNARWGNSVEAEVGRWLEGAEVVVAGQQPGLLGGPLLSLVKACAVAAEVRRRREAGRDAVGFFWLASNDDDLPEMGWARVAVGEELLEARETAWSAGDCTASHARLSAVTQQLLDTLAAQQTGERARESLALAASCYRPGARLAEASATFLGRLLRGLGVVLVDAAEPAVAQAAREPVVRLLERLPVAWQILEEGAQSMRARGWPVPLRLTPARLPLFRLGGSGRQRLAARGKKCPAALLREVEAFPARFSPNVWLRPLVQDAALHTSTALLGGAELAYHLQGLGLWELAGVPRPTWRLRPHLTVVTSADRRLIGQLRLDPEALLVPRPPSRLLGASRLRRRQAVLARQTAARLSDLATAAQRELPLLTADVQATAVKVAAAFAWLQHRTELAQVRGGELSVQRWRRLRAFLRPQGQPQERRLSVLAPLLRLGLEWPTQLAAALDPGEPNMQLLHWWDGGTW